MKGIKIVLSSPNNFVTAISKSWLILLIVSLGSGTVCSALVYGNNENEETSGADNSARSGLLLKYVSSVCLEYLEHLIGLL
jgi:hypothetical protein